MSNWLVVECVDRCLRDIKGNDCLFGGLTVLLSGDLKQILPVIKKGRRSEIVDKCIRNS